MTSYTKLNDGTWGLRVQGVARTGASVEVMKRDGTTKIELVGKVLYTGNGVSICTVDKSAGRPSTTRVAASPTRPRRNWKPCGYPGCHPSYCDECDGEGYMGYGR